MARPANPLRPNQLRWTCPQSWIPAAPKKNADLSGAARLFGQERALEALAMGLAVDAAGYNVFVCGIEGADKADVVSRLLEEMRLSCAMPRDHVFLHNFEDPLSPRHLALPAGGAEDLSDGMARWVHTLSKEMPRLLRTEAHLARRKKLFDRYQRAEKQLYRRLNRKLKSDELVLASVEDESGERYDIHYLVEGESVAPEEVASLEPAQRPKGKALAALEEARERLMPEVDQARLKSRALGLRLLREVRAMDEQVVQSMVEGLTIAVAEELDADEALANWLGDCARFALANTRLFQPRRDSEDSDKDEGSRLGLEVFEPHVVRTIHDDACPVIYEPHPNYSNLFGTVERRRVATGLGHVHFAVRPGSLLQADGGFLVLNARDVFKEAEVWRALKRTLQSGQLAVHALEGHSPLGVTGARPQPVPMDLKVVLVGDSRLYEALHDDDFDFPDIFKVRAEFEDNLPLSKEHVASLVGVLRDSVEREGLLPFDRGALRALVERGVRDGGRRNRLSSRLPVLVDFAREASYWAKHRGRRSVDRDAVEAARLHFRGQHAADAEWHRRAIVDGIYEIATEGTMIGSVNALTVISIGPLGFGRPTRVAAVAGVGDESLHSLDRDVDLAGPIHNKGLLTMENFLRFRYGTRRSLAARMGLAFEQSYGPIDGDSASSTELYALLSALTGIPLRQDVGVTGALSMQGRVLAVGGVNDKVEGFFDLCEARGLTGSQGVLLPTVNVDDLMLPPHIVEAVKAKRFHLWSAEHIDQGVELLSGMRAEDFHAAVERRLEELDKLNDDDSKSSSEGSSGGKDGGKR